MWCYNHSHGHLLLRDFALYGIVILYNHCHSNAVKGGF
jgi:hypothetical protein